MCISDIPLHCFLVIVLLSFEKDCLDQKQVADVETAGLPVSVASVASEDHSLLLQLSAVLLVSTALACNGKHHNKERQAARCLL